MTGSLENLSGKISECPPQSPDLLLFDSDCLGPRSFNNTHAFMASRKFAECALSYYEELCANNVAFAIDGILSLVLQKHADLVFFRFPTGSFFRQKPQIFSYIQNRIK